MTHPDAAAGWRLFKFTWLPIGAMTLLLAVAFPLTGFAFTPVSVIVTVVFVGVYAGFAHYNARAAHRRDPQVVFALGGTAQIVLITAVMTPMTYLAAAFNFPMQDATLLAIDRGMGLDWVAYVSFVDHHPVLADWLSYGYSMIRWPVFAIPAVLAAARRYLRLSQFTLAFLLALMVTTVISGLVPAIGVYQELGLDPASFANLHPGAYLEQLRDLPPVREGTLRTLDLLSLTGIVTFPSFHAASAILYSWALWPVRWIRPFAILANVAMLAATPIDGGHYFIDLIAGVAVAALAIWMALRVSAWAQRPAAAQAPLASAAVSAES